MKTALFSIIFTWLIGMLATCPTSNAHAEDQAPLQNCTDTQIVEKICGDGLALHHEDDTGVGLRFSDFSAATLPTGKIQTKISDEGYRRFQNSFETVVEAYRETLSRLTNGSEKGYFSYKLDSLQVPTREYLDMNPVLSFVMGPNGMYNPIRHKIFVTPEILNAPNLSSIELEVLIAHELGHYMDPNQHPVNLLTTFDYNPRSKILSASVNACFEKNFFQWNGPATFEDFADWLAAQVVPILVASDNTKTRLARILNVGFVMCEKPKKLSHAESLLEESMSGDQHSKGADRILTLLRNPQLLAALGCGPSILRESSPIPLDHCEL